MHTHTHHLQKTSYKLPCSFSLDALLLTLSVLFPHPFLFHSQSYPLPQRCTYTQLGRGDL